MWGRVHRAAQSSAHWPRYKILWGVSTRDQANELSVWLFQLTSAMKIADLHSAVPWIEETTFSWEIVIIFSQATSLTTLTSPIPTGMPRGIGDPHYCLYQRLRWCSEDQKSIGNRVRTSAVNIRVELLKSLLAMGIRKETFFRFRGIWSSCIVGKILFILRLRKIWSRISNTKSSASPTKLLFHWYRTKYP